MKLTFAAVVIIAIGIAASPVLAQGANGTGNVSGLGPGGSGAGQSTLGPSKAFLQTGHRARRRHHRR